VIAVLPLTMRASCPARLVGLLCGTACPAHVLAPTLADAHDGAGVDVPAEVQGLAVAVKRAAVAECEGKWPAAISILERAL
jgi:hypothetical protein